MAMNEVEGWPTNLAADALMVAVGAAERLHRQRRERLGCIACVLSRPGNTLDERQHIKRMSVCRGYANPHDMRRFVSLLSRFKLIKTVTGLLKNTIEIKRSDTSEGQEFLRRLEAPKHCGYGVENDNEQMAEVTTAVNRVPSVVDPEQNKRAEEVLLSAGVGGLRNPNQRLRLGCVACVFARKQLLEQGAEPETDDMVPVSLRIAACQGVPEHRLRPYLQAYESAGVVEADYVANGMMASIDAAQSPLGEEFAVALAPPEACRRPEAPPIH